MPQSTVTVILAARKHYFAAEAILIKTFLPLFISGVISFPPAPGKAAFYWAFVWLCYEQWVVEVAGSKRVRKMKCSSVCFIVLLRSLHTSEPRTY